MGEYWHNMPKASAATRSGLYKPVSEVVRETLRLLEIG
jgi:Arc/MetJ-type ribon-helix-helix transcriptional regulator